MTVPRKQTNPARSIRGRLSTANYIDGHACRLVSRRGAVRCRSAVLDGEIVCLEPDGRSHFYNLLFRREWPYFMTFDLLALDGKDLRGKPLQARKRLLAGVMPMVESQVRMVKGVEGRGVDFFHVACAHDLEGIVAKWKGGSYTSGPRTSWLKIRNPKYSQWEGRREMFDARSDNVTRRRVPARPQLALL